MIGLKDNDLSPRRSLARQGKSIGPELEDTTLYGTIVSERLAPTRLLRKIILGPGIAVSVVNIRSEKNASAARIADIASALAAMIFPTNRVRIVARPSAGFSSDK